MSSNANTARIDGHGVLRIRLSNSHWGWVNKLPATAPGEATRHELRLDVSDYGLFADLVEGLSERWGWSQSFKNFRARVRRAGELVEVAR